MLQTPASVSTQTAVPGYYISSRFDRIVEPTATYRSAIEYRQIQVRAAAKIQLLFRGYRARKKARLEMLALLDDDSFDSIEQATNTEDPKSRQDFQRLYAKLESWRVSQEKQLSSMKSGFALRRSRSKLVSEQALKLAELAANRERHKLAEKQEVVRNVIFKAGQPRIYFSSSGQMLQWETPGTTRAQEFADIYRLLDYDDDVEGTDRVPALTALGILLQQLEPCPLIIELHDLVRREEELVQRGVRATNLSGLRLRILTKYMQLVRSPDYNPEIARYESQLPVPVLHSAKPRHRNRGTTEFCLGCRNYLSRTKFSLSSGPTVGRCSNCEQLDNDARSRQDLSVYKGMLDRIKHDEESRNNTTSPIFQLQDSDIRYIVRSFWDSRSILSGLSNMYELRLLRWNQEEEWSPWNCILLTHSEADVHSQLSNLFKAYGALLAQKIRHKHTLARNHFSKMSTMANYFKGQGHGKGQKPHQNETTEDDEEDVSLIPSFSATSISISCEGVNLYPN